MKSQRWLWSSVLAVSVTVTLSAQAPKPMFEVASVRPSGRPTLSSDPIVRVLPGGVFKPTHATIENLLGFAYDLRPYRIVGGPDWVRRDLFEINARPDGPLGPKLVSLDDCGAVSELRRKFPEKYSTPTGGGIIGCSPGVSTLADYVTLLGTPVIDATGLKGNFYYTLNYRSAGVGADSIDSNLPALSSALEEQLGLKLESRRGPVDVLVIDSIQPPTQN